MNTHKVIDLIYSEDEHSSSFAGTYSECWDFINGQPMSFAYKIVPMERDEVLNYPYNINKTNNLF